MYITSLLNKNYCRIFSVYKCFSWTTRLFVKNCHQSQLYFVLADRQGVTYFLNSGETSNSVGNQIFRTLFLETLYLLLLTLAEDMVSTPQLMVDNSINFTMSDLILNTHTNTPATSNNHVIQSMIPVFICIAILALSGNFLVVFLFIRNRGWLQKAHSNLILMLAITDILTAICVLCVPLFIHESDVYSVPENEFLRELYCRVVWSHYIVFSLGVTSVYLCLSLAIERWLAISKPIFYKQHLNKKRTISLLVVTPWIAGFAFESSAIIRTAGVVLPDGTTSCRWNPDTSEWATRVTIAVVSFCGMILIPGILVVFAYIHILVKINLTSSSAARPSETRRKIRF